MEEQITNQQQSTKYDPAIAEQKYQEKLLQVKNLLARYTTEADKGNFYERNQKAIESLARGDSYSTVSDIMTGFRKLSKPDETYDARVELQYYLNEEGKWMFSPQLHFKRDKLLISPTITLPTAIKKEYSFNVNLNECKQNKLETMVNISSDGGENIKVELNEADLTELSSTRQLSRVIKSSDESNYEYRITAKLDMNKRTIEKLIITQNEKIQLPQEDIQELAQKGCLNKTLTVGEGINQRQYFVAVDKELNKLAFAPISAFAFLGKVKAVNLSPLDIRNLLAGQQVTTTILKSKDAEIQSGLQATVRLDPVKKNLKIETVETPAQKQAQAQKVAQKATISPALRAATKKMAEIPKSPAVKRQKMGV